MKPSTVRARRGGKRSRRGIGPSPRRRVAAILDASIAEIERRTGRVTVLDAGCGHRSPLRAFRPRIARLVGVDLHEPDRPLDYLDAFATVDLCDARAAVPGGPFELVVSNFTLEHFADPATALANLYRALAPGGTLVVVTVNRRHPFVAAYLGLPTAPRDRLQRVLKSSAADAHRLVGACNDPVAIRAALVAAGFEGVELETVGNLARAWGRHRATFLLGAVGDLLFQWSPGRRSTIIATARRPLA